MLPISKLSLVALALTTQVASSFAELSTYEQECYNEWKQSKYYSVAKQYVTVAGSSSGSAVGSSSGSAADATVGVDDITVPTPAASSSSSGDAGEITAGTLDTNSTSTSTSTSTTTTTTTSSTSSGSGASVVTEVITQTEEEQRFAAALATIESLKELHPHANFSVNTPFVLLTSDEFLAYVNRYSVDANATPIRGSSSSSTTTSSDSAAGPMTLASEDSTSGTSGSAIMTSAAADGETVDWQEAGCVTAVKDQGECGACWAFSATAAMESGYCVFSNGSLPSLADQELISCDTAGENQGCGGGYTAYTIDYIADTRGGKMCTLDSYPFTSDDGTVASCALSSCTEVDISVTGYESIREDPDALEDAVRTQPVSVFLYSGSSAFQYYSGGILTGDNCDKSGSHSGLAVGFGEADGIKYWRIKNQWGTDWGEEGYVRVQRRYSGDSEGACGVELYGVYPTFDGSLTPLTPTSTTATPTATTATPTATTATPTATTATPTATTATPSTTDAPASTTATPSATKGNIVVTVDDDSVDGDASADDDSNQSATPAPTLLGSSTPKDCKM